MEFEQWVGLNDALMEAYASMTDKNSLSAYQESIEPLLKGISQEDRLELAEVFRRRTTLNVGARSLAGLAFYLDPQVGGS